MLDTLSRRLLEDYNQKNNTTYTFEEVVDPHPESYLNSGIMTVLMTQHIPKQVAGRAGRRGIYNIGYVNAQGNKLSFIRESLLGEDHELEEAVLGPSEALLKIKAMPLKEKLALWATRDEKCQIYCKMDVRDYIMILDLIRRYKLSEQQEWQLMRLPFDVHNEQLQETFLEFIEAFFMRKENMLHKPVKSDKGLDYLETYYQQVNLYYSFSKNFHLPLDEEWVKEQRIKVSQQINHIITS